MSTPEPLRASKASIWRHAEKVAAKLGFGPGDAIDPLVARLGGRILYKNAPRSEAKPESMIVRSSSDFTIYLPTMTSPARDRFTVAHELGHLFLHYPGAPEGSTMIATRWVDENDPDQKRAEWEANWFAAAFLMPGESFTTVCNQHGVDDAAAIFGVSIQAAQVRARTLGLD